MSYALNIQKEADYLYIEATGTRTRDTVLALAKDCIAACKKHGYSRLLVDVQKMTGRLGTLDAYEIGKKDLVQLRQGLGLKVAIVDLEANRTASSSWRTSL